MRRSAIQALVTVDMLRKAESRFWERVDVGHPEGCWEWTRGLTGVGYGSFLLNSAESPTGKPLHIGAHRVSWALHHGQMPNPDRVLDHTCNNRKCANPHHLVEESHAWNTVRAGGVGFRTHTPKPYVRKDGSTSWRVRFRRYGNDGSVANGCQTFQTEDAARAFVDANAFCVPDRETFTSSRPELYVGAPCAAK